MASALSQFCRLLQLDKQHRRAGLFGLVCLLSACDAPQQVGKKVLALPERESASSAFITDQTVIVDKTLLLLNDSSGCRLEVLHSTTQQPGGSHWLKLMAPCYFIKSPGSDRLQVFQQDKTTRVLAVVGTPVVAKDGSLKKGCGSEVQGVLIDHRGDLRLSAHVLSGSVYCSESGLDNFQYSLFANQ